MILYTLIILKIKQLGTFMQASNIDKIPSSFHATATSFQRAKCIFNNLTALAALSCPYAIFKSNNKAFIYASSFSVLLIARKIVSIILGYIVYPAAALSFDKNFKKDLLNISNDQIKSLEGSNCTVRKISLWKSGAKYDAMLIAPNETKNNGKWSIHALGNGMAFEGSIESLSLENYLMGSNTLLINGPSVGESGGYPTHYQFGAPFESGLQFLEKEVKATHIIMKGLSLGGGMMGEAILQHDFTVGLKQGVKYLSISDRTFDKISTIAGAILGLGTLVEKTVQGIFYITGTELDGVKAAKKLSDLHIKHIIVQHNSPNNDGSDGIILDRTSLAYQLHKDPITFTDKVYLEHNDMLHNEFLPWETQKSLNNEIEKFLS